jgi:hypothetical protein
MKITFRILLPFALLIPVLCNSSSMAADHGTRVARILWQDRDTDALMWGEVFSGDKWVVTASPVKGFPKLDVEKQDLVQMEQAEGMLLIGVRDNDDGTHQSGWVAVDTGVREVPHGNHSDWQYVAAPSVKGSRLDANQGNPAHLYLYNGTFFMANDAKNGFTHVAPSELMTKPAANCGIFCSGGGNHITMAAVDNTVCYSTWIDGGGPNMGRVDVVNLKKTDGDKLAYSFTLPTGVIHGATANSGKVFFAPADGICWVAADTALSRTAETVVVNHISLGTEEGAEKPNRTGAFVNHRNWVLFTTGGPEGKSSLCLLDANAAAPSVVKLPIEVADGLSLTTPEVVLAAGGKRYAFLFQDRKEGDVQEQLTIVDLDPNGDRNLSDAKIAKTIPVPASKVDGHHGHHSVAFDSEGKLACFTNPGDGSVWVMTLKDLQIRAKSKVGGTPAAITAIGAAAHHH